MEILVGRMGELETIKVDQVLEIKIKGETKFRLKEEDSKLKIFAKEGILQIEPVASNVILVEQTDDY